MKSKLISKWNTEKLFKICKIFSGGTPSTKIEQYWNGNISWLSSGETSNSFITKTERKITLNGVKNSSTRLANKDDVVIASAGQGNTRGQVSLCLIDTYVNQSVVVLRTNKQIILPQFLFYNLKSRYTELRRISDSHSSRGSLPKNVLSDVEIIFPTLHDQRKIGKILYDLDCKITNLQNQNKILEQIAQTVFKSWFVDFDGVTEFEDSELGKIPKGWKVDKLGNFLELIKGVSYKSQDLIFSNKALVTLKSVKRGGGYTNNGLKSFDGKYNYNQVVHENDIIIAQTDLTQSADIIGKPAIIRNSKKFEILIASLDLIIVKTKSDKIPKTYLYYLFMTGEFQNHVYGYTSGTTVLHLAKDGIPNYNFILPTTETLEKFDKLISTIIQKNHKNNCQIENLAIIRDILLPKLMSGQIRIRN